MATYKAIDIANYVVHYALERGKEITHLHVQKILYYLEATRLVKTGESLFNEDIEKWKLGPVVPEVYHEYKTFGSRVIGTIPNEVVFDTTEDSWSLSFVEFNPDKIAEDDQSFIELVASRFIDYDGFTLVDMTHKHPLWSQDEGKIITGLKGLVYDKKELKSFFEENQELLRG